MEERLHNSKAPNPLKIINSIIKTHHLRSFRDMFGTGSEGLSCFGCCPVTHNLGPLFPGLLLS